MEQISLFKNFTTEVGTRILPRIVQGIRGKHYKEVIYKIRKAVENKDQEVADKLKKSLLGFTVSGEFSGGRRMEFLQKYNPFVILDIDKLDDEVLVSVVEKINGISFTRMSFVSPSGRGVKIIVKVDSGVDEHWLAYKQVAEFYEKELDVVIDKSGKDVTRLCFMSYDPSAYFNPNSEVFKILNTEPFSQSDNQSISLEAKQEMDPVISAQIPIKVADISDDFENAFAKCIVQTDEKLVFEKGNRNNYIYQLAVNCNLAGIPFEITNTLSKATFDFSNEETKRTVRSAYNWKPQSERYVSTYLLAQGRQAIELPKETPPSMPLKIFDKLPLLLREGCASFNDPRERDVFLTGAIGVLSGCLPEVQGVYDGRINYPNLYTFVIAPAASGKGALTYARELGLGYHEHLVNESQATQKTYRQELIRYESALAQHKRGKLSEPPIEPEEQPFKTLFIPANSSSAMLIRQLYNNKNGGILFESEADTLGNVLKQDWGGYSDLMRKAFHNEPISYSRKLNDQFIEITNPQLSVALSGTPNQVTTLIPSAEDGLFSRFLFYVFEVGAKWRDVSPKGKGQNFQTFYQKQSQEVMAMVRFLKKHPTKFHLQEAQWDRLNEVFSESLERTNQLTGPGSVSIVKRQGGMLFRIAMLLSGIRKFEEQQTATEVYCQEDDFTAALWLIENYFEHSLFLYERLPRQVKSSFQFKNVRKQLFYEALPNRFQRKEAFVICRQFKMVERTAARYLKELLEVGCLTQSPDGIYGEYYKHAVS